MQTYVSIKIFVAHLELYMYTFTITETSLLLHCAIDATTKSYLKQTFWL